MTPAIKFVSLPTETARAYQAGAVDANGQSPERHISAGDGIPCRHCQQDVAAGEPYLVLAYRPFPSPCGRRSTRFTSILSSARSNCTWHAADARRSA